MDNKVKEAAGTSSKLMSFGYGIVAFIDMHLYLIMMMSTIILLLLPLMWMYSTFEFGNEVETSHIHSLSLGNLGFSKSICLDTTVGSGSLYFDCTTGIISDIYDFGITPDGSRILDPCQQNEETVVCEDTFD